MPILPFHILKSNDIWIDNVIDLESDFLFSGTWIVQFALLGCVYLVQSQICFLLVIFKPARLTNLHSEFIQSVMINLIPKHISLHIYTFTSTKH